MILSSECSEGHGLLPMSFAFALALHNCDTKTVPIRFADVFLGVKEPGLFLVVPLIDQRRMIDTRV